MKMKPLKAINPDYLDGAEDLYEAIQEVQGLTPDGEKTALMFIEVAKNAFWKVFEGEGK